MALNNKRKKEVRVPLRSKQYLEKQRKKMKKSQKSHLKKRRKPRRKSFQSLMLLQSKASLIRLSTRLQRLLLELIQMISLDQETLYKPISSSRLTNPLRTSWIHWTLARTKFFHPHNHKTYSEGIKVSLAIMIMMMREIQQVAGLI